MNANAKADSRLAEVQRDYVEQLEEKGEELDLVCSLLLETEGIILGWEPRQEDT